MKLVCLPLRFALRIGQVDRSGSQDPCVYGSAAPVRWHAWNAVRTSVAKNATLKRRMLMPKLNWKLLTRRRDSSTQGLPPGKENLAWVTNTVTLMYGERNAVLVDTFLSVQHSKELVDWVAESGKNLTTIYVTHAHGDHFFGLKSLLDRFPNARAFATASSVAAMQNQINPDFIKSFWEPRFPGQVPSQLVAPEVLDGDTIHLEGEELKVVELGHTDTKHTTA